MLAGALIGQLSPSALVAFAGGFASHLALDAVPHTEGETFGFEGGRLLRADVLEAGFELAAGAAILVWLVARCPGADGALIAVGVLAGLVPDLIDHPAERLLGKTFLHPQRLHWTVGRRHWVWGVLAQVAVIGLALWGLWRLAGCG
jgi:hypothetical protein